jgi:hypothetical protein
VPNSQADRNNASLSNADICRQSDDFSVKVSVTDIGQTHQSEIASFESSQVVSSVNYIFRAFLCGNSTTTDKDDLRKYPGLFIPRHIRNIIEIDPNGLVFFIGTFDPLGHG